MPYNASDPNAIFTGFGLSQSSEPDDPLDPEDDEFDDDQDADSAEDAHERSLAARYGLTYDQIEDLWASFSNRQTLINCCNVAVAVAFFFGVHSALVAINRALAAADGPAQFTLPANRWIWWFLPGVGGFVLPWEITIRIWSLFAQRRTIALYREWAKRETFAYRGSDFTNELGLWHWFALLIVLPVAIATLLALNMHASFGPNAIRDCGYAFKPCETYPYNAITSIATTIPHETKSDREGVELILDFKDGRRWTSEALVELSEDVDPSIVRFVAERTGLPVKTVSR